MLEKYKNKIIKGDCIEVLKKFPTGSVDLIFADPPYFMQVKNPLIRANGQTFNGCEDDWDKFESMEEYERFCSEWIKECKRVLKDGGSMWVIGGFQNIYLVANILRKFGFWIINDVIWSKSPPTPNFKGNRLCNAHETLLWCSKGKGEKYHFNYKTLKFLNGGKQGTSIWTLPVCFGRERLKDDDGNKLHTTQKPIALLHNVIMASTKPGDIILDPFFGTGTTGAAAIECRRNFIGIEREEKYILKAIERLKKVVPKAESIYENLDLEAKPPKVSLKEIVESGLLKVGDKLQNKDKTASVYVLDNGNVSYCGDEMSIHKAQRTIEKSESGNGWVYFYFERNGKYEQLTILRNEYSKD